MRKRHLTGYIGVTCHTTSKYLASRAPSPPLSLLFTHLPVHRYIHKLCFHSLLLYPMAQDTSVHCSPLIFNLLIEPLTERIRSHPTITGSPLHDGSHNINLFADDIILFLTFPASSLPHAYVTLKEFRQISFYKANFTKSYIFGLVLSPSLQSQLKSSFPYTWSKSSILYLALQLRSPDPL